ncbi:MAG: hypothetical protein KIT60_06080 [Burkholderiaceae bacterium]|nr:hypothetical protein [Burkholderiaceae bacterium]
MSQAHTHFAYAPRGVGVLYAVMWFAEGDHVYGWFIGARNGGHLASYFMLQDYYAARDTAFFRSAQDDVSGDWILVHEHGAPVSHSSPVPETVRHELSRLQDRFVRHWLFFDDDAQSRAEAEALRARELPVRHINMRPDRLEKFRTAAAVWHYDSPEADRNVLAWLSKRWPLDYEAAA